MQRKKEGEFDLVVCADRIVSPHAARGAAKVPWFLCVKGQNIVSITQQDPRDEAGRCSSSVLFFRAPLVIPGFVDIHTHGVGGASDVKDYWLNPAHSSRVFADAGTTSFLASMAMTADKPHNARVAAALERVCGVVGQGAVCMGIHCEGPVVADLGGLPPTGTNFQPSCAAGDPAHPSRSSISSPASCSSSPPPSSSSSCSSLANREAASLQEFAALLTAMPSLRLMTISPSRDPLQKRIKMLVARGVRPCLGHDRQCSEAEVLACLRAAHPTRCHITHLFNVSALHHRLPSLANFGLIRSFPNAPQYAAAAAPSPPRQQPPPPLQPVKPVQSSFEPLRPPTVELIGDGVHVHPLTLMGVLGARADKDVCIVTDSILSADATAPVLYGGRSISAYDGPLGRCAVLQGPPPYTLVGSTASQWQAFRLLLDGLGVALRRVCLALSTVPAAVAGIGHVVGSLEEGKRADFLLLGPAEGGGGGNGGGAMGASSIGGIKHFVIAGRVWQRSSDGSSGDSLRGRL